jgi:CRP-like cAMP-binding protein
MYVTIPAEKTSHVSRAMLSGLVANSNETQIKAGSYLYFEGDRVEWLYQVKSGVLRLTRLLEDGRRQVIAFGYPGDIVGFPCGGLHHADCEVLVDAKLHPYRRSILESGEAHPDLHRALLQAALSEIAAMQDHFMMLGRKSAVEKVASFLSTLAERVGRTASGYTHVDLPMSRSDIADFLGLTTETVSRTFTQLRKSGVIAIDNTYTVIVRRPAELFALSTGDHSLRAKQPCPVYA